MKSQSKANIPTSPMAAILVVIVLALLVVAPSSSDAAVTNCNPVVTNLSPCRTYIQTGRGTPSPDCCTGARNLKNACVSTADKQMACTCMKNLAARFTQGNPSSDAAAKAIPGYCKINFPYTISPNTDCSKVT